MSTSICIDLSPAVSASSPAQSVGDDPESASASTITIKCLTELTPLDMMDMSFGIADPTGSCVWLGAYMFMEFFSRQLNTDTDHSDLQRYWSQVRQRLFPSNCHALELGAGTGMSGISLMVMNSCNEQTQHIDESTNYSGPSLLVQTDANDDALELCRTNRDANFIDDKQKHCMCVERMEWGKGSAAKMAAYRNNNAECIVSAAESLPGLYGTVFATDVLYDLASLVPLVTSASEMLKDDGYFILSHVPRASIDENDHETDYWQRLETTIIKEASRVGLVLVSFPPLDDDSNSEVIEELKQINRDESILRPSLLPAIFSGSSPLSWKYSWQRMINSGAGMFVFQKHRH